MFTYMAKLGDFQFSIDTAAFQELQRVASYQWQAKNRIGRKPAQQFTGFGSDTINLNGTIYPHYRGGLGQIGQMRSIAASGEPQALVYSFERTGQYCGRWCITSIEEKRTVFFEDGAPRKIEFSISLVEYGEDGGDMIANMAAAIASAASPGASVATPGINSSFASMGSLLSTVSTAAGAITGALSGSRSIIQTLGIGLGSNQNKILGAIDRASDSSRLLKRSADNGTALLGATPSAMAINTASDALTADTPRIVSTSAIASRDIDGAFGQSITPASNPELVVAIRNAQSSVGNLAKLATGSASSASRITEGL